MDNKTTLIAVGSFVGGLVIGGISTYLTVKKTFEERANRDIADVKERYALLRKEPASVEAVMGRYEEEGFDDNQSIFVANEETGLRVATEDEIIAAQKAADSFIAEGGYWGTITPEDPQKSVLAEPEFPTGHITERVVREEPEEDDRNYEPIDGEPYIITRDEWETGVENYESQAVIYYEGDDTLCDNNDTRIPDIERVIGSRHFNYFGYQSGDKDVVYIRNPRLGSDFEVVRNKGEYTVVVLGLDDEDLGRNQKQRISKMRDDD